MNFYKDVAPTAETKDGDKIYVPDALKYAQAIPDLVDRGSKSLINIADCSFTNYKEYTVSLKPGDYVVYFGQTISDTETSFRVAFYDPPNYVRGNAIDVGTDQCVVMSIPKHVTIMRIFPTIDTDIDTGKSLSFTNMMVCTKEAWDASPKFTPYAPTNRELYEMILDLQSKIS